MLALAEKALAGFYTSLCAWGPHTLAYNHSSYRIRIRSISCTARWILAVLSEHLIGGIRL